VLFEHTGSKLRSFGLADPSKKGIG